MASVDIGGTSYDTFADLDFADPYLAGDVMRAEGWAARDDTTKSRGLVSASRMLVALPWCDVAPDFSAASELVQQINSELAADLLTKPALFADASGSSNVKSAAAGSAKVEFFSPVDGGPPLPRSMWDRLAAAGLVCLPSDLDAMDGGYVSGLSGDYRPIYGRPPWDYVIAAEDYG